MLTDDALPSDRLDHLLRLDDVKSLVKRGEKQCASNIRVQRR